MQATILDIRTWVGRRPFPSPLKLDNSTEKPLHHNIGREKGRYQSSVTQVECPGLQVRYIAPSGIFLKLYM